MRTNRQQQNHITSDERAYFTMLPNMVDDMSLSVYAFRLYVHMRRVAGETGACWQSTSTLAEHCKMSAGAVSKAKAELVKSGLITVESKPGPHGDYHEITIVDVWPKNMAYYSNSELERSPHERKRSPGERKKNPIKNKPNSRTQGKTAARSQPGGEEERFPTRATTIGASPDVHLLDLARQTITSYLKSANKQADDFEAQAKTLMDVFAYNYSLGREREYWYKLENYVMGDGRGFCDPVEIPFKLKNALNQTNWPKPGSIDMAGYSTENFAAFVALRAEVV